MRSDGNLMSSLSQMAQCNEFLLWLLNYPRYILWGPNDAQVRTVTAIISLTRSYYFPHTQSLFPTYAVIISLTRSYHFPHTQSLFPTHSYYFPHTQSLFPHTQSLFPTDAVIISLTRSGYFPHTQLLFPSHAVVISLTRSHYAVIISFTRSCNFPHAPSLFPSCAVNISLTRVHYFTHTQLYYLHAHSLFPSDTLPFFIFWFLRKMWLCRELQGLIYALV